MKEIDFGLIINFDIIRVSLILEVVIIMKMNYLDY